MAEQFRIYLNSLSPDKMHEIENDFRANGNGLLSVRQTESATELFDSFAMFYYINGRLPYTCGYYFVTDGETPAGIIGEKLSLKELFAKCFRAGSNGLVLSPFPAALLLLFAGKEILAKSFLAELYKNLTVEVLSSDNSENLQFEGLTDLCVELVVRLGNFIFANHERARFDMKNQAEEISKKYDFFDDQDDEKDGKIKSDTEMDDIETIPFTSPKRENGIDHRETIAYASPRRESEDKIDEKIYNELKLENTAEIEKQTAEREKKFIKSELEQDKVDVQVSRKSDIKKVFVQRRRTIKR